MTFPHLHDLICDERGHISSARCGLWITVLATLVAFGIDAWLTLHGVAFRLPNTIYAIFGTMFTVFASWAAGPRIAQYIGPQLGQIAAGIGASARDQSPFPGMDHREDGP